MEYRQVDVYRTEPRSHNSFGTFFQVMSGGGGGGVRRAWMKGSLPHIIIYTLEKTTFITIFDRTRALTKWFSHFPKISGVLYFMIVIYGETFITNACNISISFLLPLLSLIDLSIERNISINF